MSNKDITDKNQEIPHIFIAGRLDCPKLTLCRQVVDDLLKKNISVKFEFVIAFETPFEIYKEELIKENIEFLEFPNSPIIFLQNNKTKKKGLIGSLEEFLKYLVSEFGHYEERNENYFKEANTSLLRNYMISNGNKYCYFDISRDDKLLGKVIFELFYNDCPKTCDNFFALCGNNNKLNYKNSIINRIVSNGFIQGGDLSTYNEGPLSIYKGEFADESYSVPHVYPGILGMVKKGKRKHSNECQFYITLTSLKAFDQLYVAFGRVIQGFNFIKEIEKTETYLQRPVIPISITNCGEYQV